MRQRIGIVEFDYDESGKLIETAFAAEPMRIKVADDLTAKFSEITASNSQDEIKAQAEKVLASWWSNLNDMEIADRNKFEITSEVVGCDKYTDGKIKVCRVEFYFDEKKAPTYSREEIYTDDDL